MHQIPVNGETRDRTTLLYVDKNKIISVFPQLKTFNVSTLFHILIHCDKVICNQQLDSLYLISLNSNAPSHAVNCFQFRQMGWKRERERARERAREREREREI